MVNIRLAKIGKYSFETTIAMVDARLKKPGLNRSSIPDLFVN